MKGKITYAAFISQVRSSCARVSFLSSASFRMVLAKSAALVLAVIIASQVNQAINEAPGLRRELTSPRSPQVKTGH